MMKQKLMDYLRNSNRKYSIERDDMLGVIVSMDGCYSLGELYKKASEERVIHARSTVYRNIDLFIEAGIIEKAGENGSKMHYRTCELG